MLGPMMSQNRSSAARTFPQNETQQRGIFLVAHCSVGKKRQQSATALVVHRAAMGPKLIPSKQYQLALRVELRVEIQAFAMVSADVIQRSTMSDMVSPVSMACSLSDCTKSAGSLN